MAPNRPAVDGSIAVPTLPGIAEPAASNDWMTGTFDTGGGVMHLTRSGGTYEHQNGRLTVTGISGNVMDAIWEQDSSGQLCKDGRFHGVVRLTFTEDGFTGLFGYCDEPPGAPGGFQGKRRK